MIFLCAILLSNLSQGGDNKPLKGHHLRIMQAISAKNENGLRPYIQGNVRIQHVDNCYRDYNYVFAKRFSNAQLERAWHVQISSANLNRSTSPKIAKQLLKPFSEDIGDQMISNDVWYPTTFDYKGNKGILSKIASGAYYFVELDSLVRKPRIVRIWDLDHAKGWEDVWRNREGD